MPTDSHIDCASLEKGLSIPKTQANIGYQTCRLCQAASTNSSTAKKQIIQLVDSELLTPHESRHRCNESRSATLIGQHFHRLDNMYHVTLDHIYYESLLKNTNQRARLKNLEPSKWDIIDNSACVHASNGEKLVVFFKNGYDLIKGTIYGTGWKKHLLSNVSNAIRSLCKVFPPPKPSVKNMRHRNMDYIQSRCSQLNLPLGTYHFALWFAIGHGPTTPSRITGKLQEPILSVDCRGRGSAERELEVQKFWQQLAPIHQLLGLMYQVIDPEQYLENLQQCRIARTAFGWGPFATSRRSAFHGCAVLRNVQVEPHKDHGDVVDGWVVEICSGNFTGGYLVLPQLEIKIAFEPGDVLFFKSALLEHYLEDFNGDRTAFVFFTHQNVSTFLKNSCETWFGPVPDHL